MQKVICNVFLLIHKTTFFNIYRSDRFLQPAENIHEKRNCQKYNFLSYKRKTHKIYLMEF